VLAGLTAPLAVRFCPCMSPSAGKLAFAGLVGVVCTLKAAVSPSRSTVIAVVLSWDQTVVFWVEESLWEI